MKLLIQLKSKERCKMSNEINDQYLEYKYEEGLDMGMSEEEAANYARECLEQDSAPLYEDHSET